MPASVASSGTEDDVCWICLSDGELVRPCHCPSRLAHKRCLARWQLQSAGTRRETHCEFCDTLLPDWRSCMTPASGSCAPAIMNVSFGGTAYSFEVQPGANGYNEFADRVRAAFSLPEDSDLNITFTCDEPCQPANQLTLQGRGAFDAAVHCASVSAARRLQRPHSCGGTAWEPVSAAAEPTAPAPMAPPRRASSEEVDPQHLVAPRGPTPGLHRRSASMGNATGSSRGAAQAESGGRARISKSSDRAGSWVPAFLAFLGCKR